MSIGSKEEEERPEQHRVDVLGVGVSALSRREAVEAIGRWIREGTSEYVCVTGVHGVMESQSDEVLRGIHNEAGMVTPDGMPLVWLSRLWGDRPVERVYGPDLLLDVCRESQRRGWRHFFYGGAEGVADLLVDRLRERFAALDVAGTYCPPFRPLTSAESREVIERIEASGADIVWVGLSTPKQERWMSAHVRALPGKVLIGVGAAFDFHAGLKRQAPSWMQRSGLEWLFRLLSEPRRLWRRYLVNNPAFVFLITLQALGFRRRKRE